MKRTLQKHASSASPQLDSKSTNLHPQAHAAINASSRARRTAAHVVHPLEPVFDRHARVLLLGTMPSPKSRETGFYYGHPQNRFWKVMAALFNAPVPKTTQDKTDLLHEHGIALWDVLAECTIVGANAAASLDKLIEAYRVILPHCR